jgi:hypothetical protein
MSTRNRTYRSKKLFHLLIKKIFFYPIQRSILSDPCLGVSVIGPASKIRNFETKYFLTRWMRAFGIRHFHIWHLAFGISIFGVHFGEQQCLIISHRSRILIFFCFNFILFSPLSGNWCTILYATAADPLLMFTAMRSLWLVVRSKYRL